MSRIRVVEALVEMYGSDCASALRASINNACEAAVFEVTVPMPALLALAEAVASEPGRWREDARCALALVKRTEKVAAARRKA